MTKREPKKKQELREKYIVSKKGYHQLLEATISSWVIIVFLIFSHTFFWTDQISIIINSVCNVLILLCYLGMIVRSTVFLCKYRVNKSSRKPLVTLGILMFYFPQIVGIIALTKIEKETYGATNS